MLNYIYFDIQVAQVTGPAKVGKKSATYSPENTVLIGIYSQYNPELDKSIHTLLISVRVVSLSDAPMPSLAQILEVSGSIYAPNK